MELLNIDGYKLNISSISGISEIEDLSFFIYCGGKIKIKGDNGYILERKRQEVLKLWMKNINYSDSVREIRIT